MARIDETVKKECILMSLWVFIFSLMMQAAFLALSLWSVQVLLGNLLGALGALLNFFLMGMSIQSSLSKEPKDAKSFMKFSHSMRILLLIVIAVIGYALPVFNAAAVIIPFLFPGTAMILRSAFNKRRGGGNSE